MIKFNEVKKNFKDANGQMVPILHIPCLNIRQGEQVAITGPSGCGKSTLLHMMSGVLQADSGDILIKETSLAGLTEAQRDRFRAEHIGYVFQDFHLIPSLNAEENIQLAWMKSQNRQEQETNIHKWFHEVGLSDKRKALPLTLSRGQQQRVALIRSLIHEPSILLADEPTGSLDPQTAHEMMNVMLDVCRKENMTFVCVTHDMELAKAFPRMINLKEYNERLKQGA